MKINRFMAAAASLTLSMTMLCAPIAEVYAEGYPFRTTCDYYYNQFDSNAQKLYNDLLSVAKTIDESNKTYVEAPLVYYSGIGDDEMHDLMNMFSYDHPEFFWISNRFQYGYYGTRKYVQLVIYKEYQSGSERQKARKEILEIEQAYIDGAMQYDTDYDRAKYLSDQLRDDVEYGSIGEYLDQSLASTFLYKQTVCAGFTKAYSLLANAVGVDTVAERSSVHAWNATKIADVWYMDDVTNRLFLYNDDEIAAFDKLEGIHEVQYEDGTVKRSLMHDRDYDYFTDIFPDTSKKYNGASKLLTGTEEQPTEPTPEPTTEPVTEPTTEPVTEPTTSPVEWDIDGTYNVKSYTWYFYADDDGNIDPESLVESITRRFGRAGNYQFEVEETDLSSLTLEDGWESPEAIIEHRGNLGYYHGALPATLKGKHVMIGDVWILQRGDITMDGVVNANDATAILINAASMGAGGGTKTPAGTDSGASLFAAKFVENDSDYPNAEDATAVLIYAARKGTGSV